MRSVVLVLALLVLQAPAVAVERPLVVGHTYSISERDALEEVEQRARDVDWSKIWAKGRERTRNYRPDTTAFLPAATKNRTFRVDMSKRLDIDVPDGKGGILYPRGTIINPLDMISYSRTLIVLDASDVDQVAWFNASEYAGKPSVKLLITGGSYYKTAEKLGRQVYYASESIVDRFNLAAVPSIIRQEGKLMQVEEIVVPRNRRRP